MKKFTKKLSALLMAVLLVATGHTATRVYAAGDSDTATVTIENVEAGAKVTLYTVVTAEYTGTAPNQKFTGYKLVDGLVGPNDLITVTSGSNTKAIEASILDVDKDGKVDATYNDGTTTWNVAAADQDVIYNMDAPTQEQILRVVADGLYGAQAGQQTAGATDHVSFTVPAGQYIGLIDSTGTTKTPKSIYLPVVVSAGYTQIDKMARASTTEATHYRLTNGEYTTDAPTADNYYLYENAVLNNGSVQFENAVSYTVNGTTVEIPAGSAYSKTYVKDGTTTITELVGKNLDLGEQDPYTTYDWTLEGNTAAAKRQDGPNIEKEVDPANGVGVEEVEVKMVAVDKDSNPMKEGEDLYYIHKDFTVDNYLKVVNAVDDTAGNAPTFKLVDGKYVAAITGNTYDTADGTTVFTQEATIAKMITTDPTLALTQPKTIFSAAIGDEIDYKVTPTIPVYPAAAKDKILTVADKMSDAIDFKVTETGNPDYLPIKVSFKSGKAVVVNTVTAGAQYEYYVALGRNVVDATTDKDLTDFNARLLALGSTTSVKHQGGYLAYDGTDYVVLEESNIANHIGEPIYQYLGSAFIPAPGGANDFQINFAYYALPGAINGNPESPVIEYTGVLNDKAVSGIEGATNVAKLYYNNTPGTGDDWDPSKNNPPTGVITEVEGSSVTVYSYEISLRKTNDKDEFIPAGTSADKKYYMVDEDVMNNTANAAFKAWVLENGRPMYRKESAKAVWFIAEDVDIPTEYASLVDKTSGNAYIVNPEFEVLEGAVFGVYPTQACVDSEKLFELTTNEYGFGIANDAQKKLLKKGTYYLKEIKAPEGYALSNIVTPVEVDWTKATTTITKTTTTKKYTAVKDIAIPVAPATTVEQAGWLTLAPGQSLDNATFVAKDTYTEEQWEAARSTLQEVEVEIEGRTYTVNRVVIDGKEVYRAYLLSETVDTVTEISELENAEGLGTVMVGRINNTKTSELPSTGGIGTYLFTIAGVAILSLAAFMMVFRKKEAQQ